MSKDMSKDINRINQIPKSIDNFENGDVITRVIPYTNSDGFAFGLSSTVSRNYVGIGVKFLFVGVINGAIHLKDCDNENISREFDLFKFKHGWDYYIDPIVLDIEYVSHTSKYIDWSDESLKIEAMKSIRNGDYKVLGEVSQQLSKNNKNNKGE